MASFKHTLVVLVLLILATICLVTGGGVAAVGVVGVVGVIWTVLVAAGYCTTSAPYRQKRAVTNIDGGSGEKSRKDRRRNVDTGIQSLNELSRNVNFDNMIPLERHINNLAADACYVKTITVLQYFDECYLKPGEKKQSFKSCIVATPRICAIIHDLAKLNGTVDKVIDFCRKLKVPTGFQISGYILKPIPTTDSTNIKPGPNSAAGTDSNVRDVNLATNPDSKNSAVCMMLRNMIENSRECDNTEYNKWYRGKQNDCIKELEEKTEPVELLHNHTSIKSPELYPTYLGGGIFRNITDCRTVEDVEDIVYKKQWTDNLTQFIDLKRPKNIILYTTNTNTESCTVPVHDSTVMDGVPILLWPPSADSSNINTYTSFGYVMVGFVATINNVLKYVSIVGRTPDDSKLFVYKYCAKYILYERIHPKIIEIPPRKDMIKYIYDPPYEQPAGITDRVNESAIQATKRTELIKLCKLLGGSNISATNHTPVDQLYGTLYERCYEYAVGICKYKEDCINRVKTRKSYIDKWGPCCDQVPAINAFVKDCAVPTFDIHLNNTDNQVTTEDLYNDCVTLKNLVAEKYANKPVSATWHHDVSDLFKNKYIDGTKYTDMRTNIAFGCSDDIRICARFVRGAVAMKKVVSGWRTQLDCKEITKKRDEFLKSIQDYTKILANAVQQVTDCNYEFLHTPKKSGATWSAKANSAFKGKFGDTIQKIEDCRTEYNKRSHTLQYKESIAPTKEITGLIINHCIDIQEHNETDVSTFPSDPPLSKILSACRKAIEQFSNQYRPQTTRTTAFGTTMRTPTQPQPPGTRTKQRRVKPGAPTISLPTVRRPHTKKPASHVSARVPKSVGKTNRR